MSFTIHSGKCQTKRESGDMLMEEEGEMGRGSVLQSSLSYRSLVMKNVCDPLLLLLPHAYWLPCKCLCFSALAVSWCRQWNKTLFCSTGGFGHFNDLKQLPTSADEWTAVGWRTAPLRYWRDARWTQLHGRVAPHGVVPCCKPCGYSCPLPRAGIGEIWGSAARRSSAT